MNYLDEIKVMNKLVLQGRKAVEDNEYFLELTETNNHAYFNFKDFQKNKRLFNIYIKAEVARNVWGNESFYPIFNETNEVLQQAIKLFDRIPELNRNKM